jgi:hypothetical protein
MLFDGLCGFKVKNSNRKKISGEKRGGCGEKRGVCVEKVENSGEKVKTVVKKKPSFHDENLKLVVSLSIQIPVASSFPGLPAQVPVAR